MATFTIDENNAVHGYVPSQTEPCLYQPHKPNGKAWADAEEATAWAELWVLHQADPANNPFPA